MHQAAKGKLVHSHSPCEHGRSGGWDIHETKHSGSTAALTQSAVETQQRSVNLEWLLAKPLLRVNTWLTRENDVEFLGPRGSTGQEVFGFGARGNLKPCSIGSQIQRKYFVAALNQDTFCLEASKD